MTIRFVQGLLRQISESGLRKPYWRVYKSELPKCGARCRDGHPCQMRAAWDKYRCAPKRMGAAVALMILRYRIFAQRNKALTVSAVFVLSS